MKLNTPYTYAIFFVLTFLFSCEQNEKPDAQKVIDSAIATHGGANLDQSIISFKLRDKQYRALRDNGAFVYSRTFTDDSTGRRVHDVLSNSGFKRSIDDVEVDLPEERQQAYSASVNSVVYFALLPYFLNDAAVQKEYLSEATIKGEPYHKIKVTFAQESGGKDHEDEYIYWIHQKRNTMDYFAYSYKEEDGSIGTRFREAVNPRKVGEVLFQDYMNYTSNEKFPLDQYDKVFEAGKLKKVSEINLEEIKVKTGFDSM